MINVTLKGGAVKEFEPGVSPADVAKSIGMGLYKSACAARVDGEAVDLRTPLEKDCELEILTFDSPEGKHAFWHTGAHIMAQAIQHLFPDAQFGIGPALDDGWYYDIGGTEPFTPDQFEAIEAEIKKIVKADLPVEKRFITVEEGREIFKGQTYKLELLEEYAEKGWQLSVYRQGDFTDLCAGPHLMSTGAVKAVKLLSTASAYWRGDAARDSLCRVYGTAYPKAAELEAYLNMLEEAKKRDHRKLGKELELFCFSQRVGQGLPLWLPKGAALRDRLEQFLRGVQKEYGYQQVITPHIGNKELYVTSGHYAKYGKDSFQPIHTPIEGEEYLLKPMNCPHHCEIYRSKPRSYKELPVRLAEFGTVYRYEQSGELHGLTRVRGFTQDDAHMFVRPDQLLEEFEKVIDIVLYIFKTLKFDNYTAQISLRDPNNKEKYIGSDENWEKAESAIIQAAKEKGLNTVIEYGEAAFYGPKLDFMVRDAIGRKWQLGTIQVDYNLPERFDLTYKGADDKMHRPIMIHRAPFGSMERFVAVLLEHTGGKFPLWLSPDQVVVLPISEKFNDYAEKVSAYLNKYDIRSQVDDRNEKIGRKIRDNELKRIPYLLIVGEKEEAEGLVSVRAQGEGDKGQMTLEAFRDYMTDLVSHEIDANKMEQKN